MFAPFFFFFFNDTATTEIYTLSLHDALPISTDRPTARPPDRPPGMGSHSRRPRAVSRRHPRAGRPAGLRSLAGAAAGGGRGGVGAHRAGPAPFRRRAAQRALHLARRSSRQGDR